MIKAVNVSKRFGEVLAVDNVSLEIPDGTILGMIGPNGSGKTTLIRMMVGILKPNSGACFIGEKRADLLTPQERATIGYMTQQKALYPDLTVGRISSSLRRPMVSVTRRKEPLQLMKLRS